MPSSPKPTPDCPFEKRFPSALEKDDEYFMTLAYNQAIAAWNRGEVPVGAVISHEGEAIASAHNLVESTCDPTAHAEILAITQASKSIGDWRLNKATLYVTKEPCPMCSGACMMSRLGRVVYAVPDPKMGGLGGLYDVSSYKEINHSLTVSIGVMQKDCLELLQAFFRLKRVTNKGSV